MRSAILSAAAIVGGMLFCPAARASDTTMLAGVGSLSSARDLSAPTITLERTTATKADDVDVYFPLARAGARAAWGTARVAAGYPFRPWGGYRGWGWGAGWYRPWGGYRPLGWGWGLGWRRPWGWYRPWVGGYGVGYALAEPWYGGYSGYSSGISIVGGGYPCGCGYDGSIGYGYPSSTITYPTPAPLPAETAPPPRPRDVAPPPAERAPMPMTPPTAPPKPVTPPTVPAVYTVVRKASKKIEYPAYGETPADAPSRPNRQLVKEVR